jgi:hypothetical protein
MQVRFKVFHAMFGGWESVFEDVAKFASHIPRDRLISISHSSDRSDGVVTVWYWGEEGDHVGDESWPG